jgi:RNA polymerase sigma-70 factor (ECF subfamily)
MLRTGSHAPPAESEPHPPPGRVCHESRDADGGLVRHEDDFDAFYLGSYARLVAELYGVVGLADAEDAVQEAFARASVRWERIRDYDQPVAWVRRVAFNLAVSSLRSSRRKLAAYGRLGPPPLAPPPSEDAVLLGQALRRLPRRHREVLVLHYLADLPVEEIASVLSIPAGTVKGRLFRARAALERELGEGRPAEASHA